MSLMKTNGTEEVLALLEQQQNIALVSDAGMHTSLIPGIYSYDQPLKKG
jgi:16S rRNA C1402 (ribose-2'-O) methylase RsmI